MGNATTVNPQITDAVDQVNVKVLGEAPALALGSMYQAFAQSVSTGLQNAVAAQQAAGTVNQAAIAQAVELILSQTPSSRRSAAANPRPTPVETGGSAAKKASQKSQKKGGKA